MSVKIFGIELSPPQLEQIAAHAEAEYPDEACGVGFRDAHGKVVRVLPMKNVQDRYHQLDPEAFTRTARDAFRIDELERLRALEAATADGLEECLIYHSHCDAGAYFSAEDRAMAVRDGVELVPGAINLVVSVRDGHRVDAAAFRYERDSRSFAEHRVAVSDAAPVGPPDLELRAMDARESSRPIRPVGGRLVPRVVTKEEQALIHELALGRRIEIDAKQERRMVQLGLGVLSPLTGFLRTAEVGSVEARGRLMSGISWIDPVELKGVKGELEVGALVELVGAGGRALGAMGVADLSKKADGSRLGGPVYVYPATLEGLHFESAADVRAELVRAGAGRVIAILEDQPLSSDFDLTTFDAVISKEHPGGALLHLPFSGLEGSWLGAAMAQNLGATHVHLSDRALASVISDTLEIQAIYEG